MHLRTCSIIFLHFIFYTVVSFDLALRSIANLSFEVLIKLVLIKKKCKCLSFHWMPIKLYIFEKLGALSVQLNKNIKIETTSSTTFSRRLDASSQYSSFFICSADSCLCCPSCNDHRKEFANETIFVSFSTTHFSLFTE